MATTNDITGDKITSKTNTDKYRENWDRIFGKKPVPEVLENQEKKLRKVSPPRK